MRRTAAKVLCDSTADGVRFTTLLVTFPRFILAEVNTHRMLSRNSASSRAIPPERQIEAIRRGDFFVPVFGSRVTGMGQGDDIDGTTQELMQNAWREMAQKACSDVELLLQYGSDKSHANRLLEPFLWHTAIISATEWQNFFNLRIHPAAAPEIREMALAMQMAMDMSEPTEVLPGNWHLPLLTEEEHRNADTERWAHVSAGRCARVSFERQDEYEDPSESYERAQKLSAAGHWSPFEHVACVDDFGGYQTGHGNLRPPWVQLRKYFPEEAVFLG